MVNRIKAPIFTVQFPDDDLVSTGELLEIFDISYDTLYNRQRQSGFPKPYLKSAFGREAMYKVSEVEAWCKRRQIAVLRARAPI